MTCGAIASSDDCRQLKRVRLLLNESVSIRALRFCHAQVVCQHPVSLLEWLGGRIEKGKRVAKGTMHHGRTRGRGTTRLSFTLT